MRVLVTGANGFVGAEIARFFLAEGEETYALVRAGANRRRLDRLGGLRVVDADIATPHGRQSAAGIGAEVCVHAAWYAEPGKYLSSIQNLDLQAATLQLARTLFDAGCRRFVGVGTCFEYDTDAGYLSERTPLAPAHLYSAAKAGTYLALRELGALANASTAWARLFYMYGPDEYPGRLVPSIARALLRGEEARSSPGQQVRDFLHVEDAGAAIASVAMSDVVDAVNIGSGEPVTVAEIVRHLGALTGRADLVRLGALPYGSRDPMFVCADNRKLRSQTRWKPKWGLAEGLREAVEFWRSRWEEERSPKS